ncbi:hypothetical protein CEXT_353721 [Caerostris extrusa]|uniref:Uncharacterized protein n=1 Tax=Caerostris extrusa TaxID=172846 RepID=A0AAV4QRY3_CAEEX|nr:hypothetical protein CEXT_353721 [Caerostris extrusa]
MSKSSISFLPQIVFEPSLPQRFKVSNLEESGSKIKHPIRTKASVSIQEMGLMIFAVSSQQRISEAARLQREDICEAELFPETSNF